MAFKKKIRPAVNFFVNAIVKFEEWLMASIIIQVGKVWKLFRGLQNKLRKAFIRYERFEQTHCVH